MSPTFINAKAFAQGNRRQMKLIESFIQGNEPGSGPSPPINAQDLEDEDTLKELEKVGLLSTSDKSKRWRLIPDEEFASRLTQARMLPGDLETNELCVGNHRFQAAQSLSGFPEMKAYARCPNTPRVDRIVTCPHYEGDTWPVLCPFCLEKVSFMDNGQLITDSFAPSCNHLLFFVTAPNTSVFEAERLQHFLKQADTEDLPWGHSFLPGDLIELAAMSSISRRYGMLNWPGSVGFELYPNAEKEGFGAFISKGTIGFARNDQREN